MWNEKADFSWFSNHFSFSTHNPTANPKGFLFSMEKLNIVPFLPYLTENSSSQINGNRTCQYYMPSFS